MRILFSAIALSIIVVSSGCAATTSDESQDSQEATNDGQPTANPGEETGQTSEALGQIPKGPCGEFIDDSGPWDRTYLHNCSGHAMKIFVNRKWQLDYTFCINNGETKYMSDTWRLYSWNIVEIYSGTYCPA